jgi:hypothetical protein
MTPSFTDDKVTLDWYKVRDMLFGHCFVSQNIPQALKCDHPDARWLIEVCAGRGVKTDTDARAVFLSVGERNALACCYAWMFRA